MKYKKALAYEKAPQVCEPRRLCLSCSLWTCDYSNCFTDFRQSAILLKIVC